MRGYNMHKMRLTDFPRFIPIVDYEAAIEAMVAGLARLPGITAIYQIGGVSHPGISDIDLYAVFEDNACCEIDPLQNLPGGHEYLFIHHIFGTSAEHFAESQRYPFFHKYCLLHGKDQRVTDAVGSKEERRSLEFQSALEYMIKMYINMTVERTYGILRVRGVLLHARALVYDLDSLGVTSGRLHDLAAQALYWRQHWFERAPAAVEILEWHQALHQALQKWLEEFLPKYPLYLPEWADRNFARNMSLEPSTHFGHVRRGIRLPLALSGLGRRYFNLQHRINQFTFLVPSTDEALMPALSRRHEFISRVSEYNSRHLPSFIPVPYGLAIFRKQSVAGNV
jgi:hypothetical protein